MSSEVAIKVTGLGKCYHIYNQPRDRLKQFILPFFKGLIGQVRKNYYREFWALNDVSFEIKRGESIGIIGRNGSGKSTLLQMICGTLSPTNGTVITNGRVAALLELGSGFNPEFTGRENVQMYASVLGLSNKEIEQRLDEIIAFSEIGDFIEQPVKSYSSGMAVRLAFSVIAHVDADILVVDEALSVGDVFFSQKCMRFFEGFQKSGGTVLFVSHDTSAVMKLCQSAILLSSGHKLQQDSAEIVCKTYLGQLYAERQPADLDYVTNPEKSPADQLSIKGQAIEFSVPMQIPNGIFVSPFNQSSDCLGIGGAVIFDAGYFDVDGNRLSDFNTEEVVIFSIFINCKKRVKFPAIGLVFKDRLGQAIFTESTTWSFDGQYGDGALEFSEGDVVKANFSHSMPNLCEGEYSVTIAVAEGFGHDHVQHHLIHDAIILRSTGRRVVHGISGLSNLHTSIQISKETLHNPP